MTGRSVLKVAAVLAVLSGGILSLVTVLERRDAVAVRLAAALVEQERLRESLSRLEARAGALGATDAEGLAWTGADRNAVAAQVQSAIARIAAETGVTLRTVTAAGDVEIPFAEAVGLRLEGEGAIEGWTSFLTRVEFGSPPLVIDRASLRRVSRPNAGAEVFVHGQIELVAPYLLGGA